MKVSELNRRVTFTSYTYSKNTYGSAVPVIAETFETWAKVRQLGGETSIKQAQDISTANYEFWVRYRPGITENFIITYEGLDFKIQQIQYDNEAYKRFIKILASVTVKQTSWS